MSLLDRLKGFPYRFNAKEKVCGVLGKFTLKVKHIKNQKVNVE